ncbi:hypothetical protein HW278_00850 [Capnocytophaga sp. oral taxon 902]|uniref:hypothetical protein n=1 Tax=Capnocytophaga sp. oral taxon 902 TaxID=2748316 RepID=UPI0015C0EEFB|nr:hypothetical protein [Capnocytophaga sp. oral taxon 902]QLF49353.1 hypothetical protein HW278_00850 [Capnocytophaga sp. oral taxon 902]
MKRRRKYPLPSHILSFSETSPKERECSNQKVRRTKDEQMTVRAARADKEMTKEKWG